jgi:hypothetical protein
MTVSEPNPKAEDQRAAARRLKSSGVVVPHAPYWYQRLGAWLVFALIRIV